MNRKQGVMGSVLLAGLALSACVGQVVPAAAPDVAEVAEAAVEAEQVRPAEVAPAAGCAVAEGETVEIAEAKLYIEYNFTDADVGVHGLFDDHGWSELCVYDPDGALVLRVGPEGPMGDLGIAGIFFEGREPPLEEFGIDDLKARYPEGEYAVVGTNYDGTAVAGNATFKHDIPTAPVILSPQVVDEELAEEAVVPTEDVVVAWEAVTETVDGEPATITGYEVIITNDDHEDPHGMSRPIYDVHVGADHTSLSVPAEFFEADTLYELEVIAIEESGNQTIGLGFFVTP